jgi:hypothetical protein
MTRPGLDADHRGETTRGVTMANQDQGISGERLGIEVILSVSLWILVVLAAFFLVGVVAGIIAVLVGIALFGWWLARMIRSGDVS